VQVRLPIVLLASLIVGMVSLDLRAQDSAPNVKTSYTSLRKFTLPFKFAATTGKIRELRLFYSLNGGQWRKITTINGEQDRFDVDTDQDGEYTFAVQAEYENGSQEPTQLDQLRPHIRIIVDSAPPNVKIAPLQGNPGTGGVEWLIEDPNLDPTSVRLECRYPGQVEWMSIEGTYRDRGDYFWQLKQGQKLEVRVTARDRSKQPGQSQIVTTPPDGNGFQQPMNSNFGSNKTGQAKQFYINSKRITLETKVLVGKSGIAQVDLYQNSGNGKWSRVEQVTVSPTDANPNQPAVQGDPNQPKLEFRKLTFEVQKEGLYGYIVGGKNGVGLGPGLPPDNTPARVLIEVDWTPPSVVITESKVVPSGLRGNVLNIGWRVNDPNLAQKPIIIEISEDPNAKDKWTIIVQGLDNTGRYVWAVPENAPPKFYVRIRAIDRAGNPGEAITTQPVIADHHVPEFEIEGVEPAPMR